MRIAHILGSLGMGGAERVALDLATMQRNLGHQVLVISLSDSPGGPLAEAFEEAQIAVHRVAKKPGLDWTLPPRIARRLHDLRIEVVHTHNTPPLVYAAAAGRLSGLAVVHTKHGEGHLVSRGGQFLRRLGAPFVHSFVAVSEMTAEHARREWAYPIPSRIRVITNGIRTDTHRPDPEARRAIRIELGIPEDAWLIGTVGRCDDNKNQVCLVEAAQPALSNKVHLVIAGDGESMPKLEEAVASCARPQSVHLLGRRMDAHRIIAAMDVFALPSLSEGLPLVILEAMATELPVVSTAVGGIPKVIEEGKTGYLVPAGDAHALGERLAWIERERGSASAVGRAAREEVCAHYSAERMAEDYLALYQRAL